MSKINPDIHKNMAAGRYRPKKLSYYLEGIILQKDPFILSEVITLLESRVEMHKQLAYEVLLQCYGKRSQSIRIGITGAPGVGKSSLINSYILATGHPEDQLAVLTIDPSSGEHHGSILGDKTRMDEISNRDSIFIRPSPSSQHLGGINYHSFEAVVLCEAAGKEIIFIETVGIGQSETDVADISDCTVLLVNPGAGDEIQAIKKGILEKADIVVINKADGELFKMACAMREELNSVFQIQGKSGGTCAPVVLYSARDRIGNDELRQCIQLFISNQQKTGAFSERRIRQNKRWFEKRLYDLVYQKAKDYLDKSGQARNFAEWNMESDSPFYKYLCAKMELDKLFRA